MKEIKFKLLKISSVRQGQTPKGNKYYSLATNDDRIILIAPETGRCFHPLGPGRLPEISCFEIHIVNPEVENGNMDEFFNNAIKQLDDCITK